MSEIYPLDEADRALIVAVQGAGGLIAIESGHDDIHDDEVG